jgi:hypothetical protein
MRLDDLDRIAADLPTVNSDQAERTATGARSARSPRCSTR